MVKITVTRTFEFDEQEIAELLELVGRESQSSIRELGLDVNAHERLYAALSEAAYTPMLESAP